MTERPSTIKIHIMRQTHQVNIIEWRQRAKSVYVIVVFISEAVANEAGFRIDGLLAGWARDHVLGIARAVLLLQETAVILGRVLEHLYARVRSCGK